MFQPLKTKNERVSVFHNAVEKLPRFFSKSAGAQSSVVKSNDADRLIRCRHCGWICDQERDVNLKDQTWAGYGIQQGPQLTAGVSAGDASSGADKYHNREVISGCPACGSYVYHPRQPIINFPK